MLLGHRNHPAPPSTLCLLVAALLLWAACALPARATDTPVPAQLERLKQLNLQEYWASEKLDGVRAHWDGQALRTRNGHRIAAPAWFTAVLPADQPLEGELWMGRGSFERLSAALRRSTPDDAEWHRIRYMLFEIALPDADFSQRVHRLEALSSAIDAPWVAAIPQRRIGEHSALLAWFAEVVRAGGEGLMLQRGDAAWQAGRSPTILKLTPWLDGEARVLAHLPGKGRLHGLTGSLLVETTDGRVFRLGSGLSDALRRDPPPLGSLVTYRYRALTAKGLPRFARFVRVREWP